MPLAGVLHALFDLVSRAVFVVDHQGSVTRTHIHAVDSSVDVDQRIERITELFFDAREPSQRKLAILEEAAKIAHQLQPYGFRTISLRHTPAGALFFKYLVKNRRPQQWRTSPFRQRAMENAALEQDIQPVARDRR